MRPFNRDHPHIRSPKGAMSCEEIRCHVRELLENPAHGWKAYALGRALGFGDRSPDSSLKSKLRRSWIYPGEQLRMSRQLARVLAGEIICVDRKAVIADKPVPLRLPVRFRYNLAAGAIERVQHSPLTRNVVLPTFRSLMLAPENWNPR